MIIFEISDKNHDFFEIFLYHGSYKNPRMKFNDFSMTFSSSNGRTKC